MDKLIETLGINWKLLAAQVVNFLIILTVLRFTVYKPLLAMLKKRREKIEKGLKDAEDAGKILQNMERIKDEKITEAEKESLKIIERAQIDAKGKEEKIISEAREKEKEIIINAERVVKNKQLEAQNVIYQEAGAIINEAINKVVSKRPKEIDEVLIDEALQELKKESL